ncbi:hypothetical protein BC829DRAFT_287728 [Chytridium lagenaria]|nr:hypothetical protein BC829DRAFT_287728 [Chytridium lagenaria]
MIPASRRQLLSLLTAAIALPLSVFGQQCGTQWAIGSETVRTQASQPLSPAGSPGFKLSLAPLPDRFVTSALPCKPLRLVRATPQALHSTPPTQTNRTSLKEQQRPARESQLLQHPASSTSPSAVLKQAFRRARSMLLFSPTKAHLPLSLFTRALAALASSLGHPSPSTVSLNRAQASDSSPTTPQLE